MKILLTILILLSGSFQLLAQISSRCDSVIDNQYLESEPQYGKGLEDVMNYSIQKLTPLLSESMKQSGLIPTRMIAKLLINQAGQVEDVEFIELEVTEEYKLKVKNEIQTMKWKPALMDDKPVCAIYFWNIRCFKWG